MKGTTRPVLLTNSSSPQPPGRRTKPARQGVGGPYLGSAVTTARTAGAGRSEPTAVIAPSTQAVPAIRGTTIR